jgi:predicted RNA-binding protein with PUA domain
MFYTPYPDELKLVFKTNIKKKGSKIIEEREIKSFNKQRIEIDLNKRYYTKGRLNLIVDLIWQERPNIKTSHEVYVQLDKNEAPDYYNIDAITPDL